MTQAMNPYLPEYEYIPDGEPYVFGDRVYLFGSHDRAGGRVFCLNDYVCWSAPVDDLGDWRYEGVIYRRSQDPLNRLGLRLLFAPDVERGPDGRFYLYYGFDLMGVLGVAVADAPAGPYEFLAHVCWPDGTPYGRRDGDGFPFDPAVLLDDDGRVWLYSGFYKPVPARSTGGKHLRFDGGYVLELEPDMHTIRGSERLVFPKEGPGSFVEHEFFEASSIRKYDGTYYFVYSSRVNHELCYATSDRPDGGFSFGGVLVSIGDVGLPGAPDEDHANNYLGNTHGGLLRLGTGDDQRFFIFYHRQTHRTSFSRQACAEQLRRREDGGFDQAEVTSCGLNGGPLAGHGTYPARIACNLWAAGHRTGRYDLRESRRQLHDHPYVTFDAPGSEPCGRQFVANVRDGAVVGFKYFDLRGLSRIDLTLRGRGTGEILVARDPDFADVVARIPLGGDGRRGWHVVSAAASAPDGPSALYLRHDGAGAFDLLDITLA